MEKLDMNKIQPLETIQIRIEDFNQIVKAMKEAKELISVLEDTKAKTWVSEYYPIAKS